MSEEVSSLPRISFAEIAALGEYLGLSGEYPARAGRALAKFVREEAYAYDLRRESGEIYDDYLDPQEPIGQSPVELFAVNGKLRCDDQNKAGLGPHIFAVVHEMHEQTGSWPQEMELTYLWNPGEQRWTLRTLDLTHNQRVRDSHRCWWIFDRETGTFNQAIASDNEVKLQQTPEQMREAGIWVPMLAFHTRGTPQTAAEAADRTASMIVEDKIGVNSSLALATDEQARLP